jgi:hypothetical protein
MKTLRYGTALTAGLATSLASGFAAGALAPLLGLWTVELRRSGAGSEYFQEELLPGLLGILLGFGGAALGARKNVARPDGPRDAS